MVQPMSLAALSMAALIGPFGSNGRLLFLDELFYDNIGATSQFPQLEVIWPGLRPFGGIPDFASPLQNWRFQQPPGNVLGKVLKQGTLQERQSKPTGSELLGELPGLDHLLRLHPMDFGTMCHARYHPSEEEFRSPFVSYFEDRFGLPGFGNSLILAVAHCPLCLALSAMYPIPRFLACDCA